ncbi:MAG: WbuC family cupin fold metalloprotein [Methylococcaceae bacterium]|nr:WbuC family cupin fold metalloprotein [Prolixibacteraceae bacterium]
MKIISDQTLSELSQKAALLPRRRLNLNFHEELSDPINRMLNAFELGTYIQPHKHENPDKREVFIVLRGSLLLVIFDDSGNPIDFILLDPAKGTHAIEIPAGVWHSVISLAQGTVVYEIKDGPYIQPLDKNFASWAPKEGDMDCENYLSRLTDQYYQR